MKEGTGELSVTAITVIIVIALLAVGTAIMALLGNKESGLPYHISEWFKGIFTGIPVAPQ